MSSFFELNSKKAKIVLDINELDELLSSYLSFYEAQKDIIDPARKALLEIRTALLSNNSSIEYDEKYGSIKDNINKLLPNSEHEQIKPRMLDLLEKIEQKIHEYFEFYNVIPQVTGGKRKTRKSRKSRRSRKGRKSRKSRKVRRY
jgi:hypothetical protein